MIKKKAPEPKTIAQQAADLKSAVAKGILEDMLPKKKDECKRGYSSKAECFKKPPLYQGVNKCSMCGRRKDGLTPDTSKLPTSSNS